MLRLDKVIKPWKESAAPFKSAWAVSTSISSIPLSPSGVGQSTKARR